MPFAPTITHDSTSCPGVKFTVHRIGLGRRTDIEFQVLKHSQRMRELEAETPSPTQQETDLRNKLALAYRKTEAMRKTAAHLLSPEREAAMEAHDAAVAADVDPLTKELLASIPVEIRKARAVIDEEYNATDSRIKAAWIRAGLISIDHKKGGIPVEDGLDGMTADQLLDFGPTELALEIHKALADDGKLRGMDTRNFRLPTISGAVADGASPNTTAPDAEAQLVATT